MGGAVSRLDETDWDVADGGLESADQTIDGAPPTTSYQTYHLIKKAVLASQRGFDVTDSQSNLVYSVKPSPGTIAGFDVLGVGSATSDVYLLRVTADLARRTWIVYRFDQPVFENQQPDTAATEKFAMEQTAASSATDDLDSSSSSSSQPATRLRLLYKVCSVTVSWSRYMAVAAQYGPPTADQLLDYEASREKQQQRLRHGEESSSSIASSVASALGFQRNNKQTDEGLVLEASSSSSSSDLGLNLTKETSRNGSRLEIEKQQIAEAALEVDDATHANVPVFTAKDGEDSTLNSAPAGRCDKEKAGTNSSPDVRPDALGMCDSGEDVPSTVPEATSMQEIGASFSADTSVSEIHTSASMPELALDGAASPASSGAIRSWWKRKCESFQSNSKSASVSIHGSSGIEKATSAESSQKSSFFGNSKPSLGDNPLEGVVDLDKPLTMCQEIYTKLIGNHQTMRIPKSKALMLLKQDMEQHLREENEKTGSKCDKLGVSQAVADVSILAASRNGEESIDPSESDRAAGQEKTKAKPETSEEYKESEDSEDQPASAPPVDEPLFAYWHWDNSFRTHKVKMHLVKGADLALHVVLAVLVNQVRYERNAIAATV